MKKVLIAEVKVRVCADCPNCNVMNGGFASGIAWCKKSKKVKVDFEGANVPPKNCPLRK